MTSTFKTRPAQPPLPSSAFRVPSFLFLLAALFLLPIVATAQSLAPAPQSTPPAAYKSADLGITFPTKLAGMVLTKITDYEKQGAGLGVGLTYESQGSKVDIYIYTAGYANIPGGTDSTVLGKEFQASFTDLQAMEQMGFYRNVKASDIKDVVPIGGIPFLHTQYTLEIENIPRISQFYLGALKNRFVKVRCTYIAADQAKEQAVLQPLLTDLAKLLDSAP